MRKIDNSRRGQSLVEALIALSILTTGFIGITTLLTKSFQLDRTTMNDTQATYLASEGIEVVKNLVDHDVYAGFALSSSTHDFDESFTQSGYYYNLDYNTTSTTGLTVSSGPQNKALYFHSSTDSYDYSVAGGTVSDFVRNIKITNSANQIDVQSAVTWTDAGTSNTITLEDHFYNWHP